MNKQPFRSFFFILSVFCVLSVSGHLVFAENGALSQSTGAESAAQEEADKKPQQPEGLPPGVPDEATYKALKELEVIGGKVEKYKDLLSAIRAEKEESEKRVESAIEQEKLRASWKTGRLILAHYLKHKDRADYGKELMAKLAKDLNSSETEIYYVTEFARAYPIFPSTGKLSWTHYRELLAINNAEDRNSLAAKADKESWTVQKTREELRKYAEAKNKQAEAAGAPAAESLPDVVPGQPYFYKVVKNPASGKLGFDLGFSTYLDLSEKTVFHENDIVELIEAPEVYPEPAAGEQVDAVSPQSGSGVNAVHTQQTTELQRRSQASDRDLFTYNAYILEVIDGDTVRALVQFGFGITQVQVLRLYGIDAPEVKSKEGKEAKAFLEKLLRTASSVEGEAQAGSGESNDAIRDTQHASRVLIRATKSDKYDRYLADLFLPVRDVKIPTGGPQASEREDSRVTYEYVNSKLVEEGHADAVQS